MGGVAICAISSVITIFAAWITCVVSMATDYWISSNKVCFTFVTLVLWENTLNIYNGKVFLFAGLIIVSVSSLQHQFCIFYLYLLILLRLSYEMSFLLALQVLLGIVFP